MTRSRYRIFETEYPYFLTDTVVAWLPIFSHPQLAGIIFDSWRFLQRERGVRLFGYVIMEIGFVLCKTADHAQVRLALTAAARKIGVATYQTALPDEKLIRQRLRQLPAPTEVPNG